MISEISLKQMENCIMELEDCEKSLYKQQQALQDVYDEFDSLVDDQIDKKAILNAIESLSEECASIKSMREVLIQIVRYYKETENKIVSTHKVFGTKNQFGLNDLGQVTQVLNDLDIFFK